MYLKILTLTLVALICSCKSTNSASYNYTQKQIENNDLNFETRLRIDEYINGFPQDNLAKPKENEDLSVQVDYFTDQMSANSNITLAQVAVRTRAASSVEKKSVFGISLVLDISGSMSSDHKFEDSIEAVIAMIEELNTGTEFALVTFSNEADVVIEPTIITSENKQKLIALVKKIKLAGGTNIESGLILGYKTLAQFQKGLNSRLLLLTDGMSNVGVTDPVALAEKAKVQFRDGARISTIGLGFEVDEKLLRTIAEKGQGAYYFAENSKALKILFRKDIESLMIPIVQSTQLKISANQAVIKRIYGIDSLPEQNTYTKKIGEMNSDDWRVYIVELEKNVQSNTIQLNATVDYSTFKNSKNIITKTATKSTQVTNQKNLTVNKTVARNAILFSNALTLIEVSKLDKISKYQDAEAILNIQLTNVEVALGWERTEQMQKEYDNLLKVRKIVNEKSKSAQINTTSVDVNKQKSTNKSIIKAALTIAEKAIPGPWSIIINLLNLGITD